MKMYQCPECGATYLECDLVRTKCSENGCAIDLIDYCPKCFNKRKPKFVKLVEHEGILYIAGARANAPVASPVLQEDKSYKIHFDDMTYSVSAKDMAKAIEAELYKDFNFMESGA